MTAAQFEDREGRDLVEAIHARKAASGCTCYVTDPKYWFIHYGAVEPGSMYEPNPDCPQHFPGVTVPTTTRPIHLPTDKETR